jgi:hypothetical protein
MTHVTGAQKFSPRLAVSERQPAGKTPNEGKAGGSGNAGNRSQILRWVSASQELREQVNLENPIDCIMAKRPDRHFEPPRLIDADVSPLARQCSK